MNPRDISQSQLWIGDDWNNSSLSSLDSDSDAMSSDDEDDDSICCGMRRSKQAGTQATLDRLTEQARAGGRKRVPSKPRQRLRLNKPATTTNKGSLTRTGNHVVTSRTSRSTNELVFLNSPMRKFRSNTSDGNLSTSRSFQSQRRKASQANANAMWDASDFRKIRRARPQPSLTIVSRQQPPLSQSSGDTTLPEVKTATEGIDGSVNSKETRWSTSTHTLRDPNFIRRPLRQKSEDSLSCGSFFSAGEDSAAPKRKGRKPSTKEAIEGPEEKVVSEKTKKVNLEASASDLQQRILMHQVVRDVMNAARICDDVDLTRLPPVIDVDWKSAPAAAPTQRHVQHPSGSLVSMISPFHSKSPPRQRLPEKLAGNDKACDFIMEQPKRRGSWLP